MRLHRILKPSLFILFLVLLPTLTFADFQAGLDAYKRGDYQTAKKKWLLLADQGDAKAQLSIGTLYLKGLGVPQDSAKAARWFRLAAEQGNANAQLNLGILYQKGKGVSQDNKEAIRWFRLAAEQGNAKAAEKASQTQNAVAKQVEAMRTARAAEAARMAQEKAASEPEAFIKTQRVEKARVAEVLAKARAAEKARIAQEKAASAPAKKSTRKRKHTKQSRRMKKFAERRSQPRVANSISSKPSPSNRISPTLENNLDSLLQAMPLANIAFNAPSSMNIESSSQIHLILDVNKPIEELKAAVAEEGEKFGATIRVSNRMEARLSGQNFLIASISKEVQAVSHMEPTEWKWEVHPKEPGEHNLHLTLSALLQVENRETYRMIKTFDQMIQVRVTMAQNVESFISGNWKWLWAAVLVPVAGWIWNRVKKQNEAKVKEELLG